jgi:hypothetical protein
MTTLRQLRNAATSLPEDAVAEIPGAHPTAEPITRRGRALGGVIPLAGVDGRRLNDLVRRAWLFRAPKHLSAESRAAETAEPGTGALAERGSTFR